MTTPREENIRFTFILLRLLLVVELALLFLRRIATATCAWFRHVLQQAIAMKQQLLPIFLSHDDVFGFLANNDYVHSLHL